MSLIGMSGCRGPTGRLNTSISGQSLSASVSGLDRDVGRVFSLFSRSPRRQPLWGGALLTEKEPAKVSNGPRHPFLWGVALWSVTHLVINAISSVIFFGFSILAVVGPFQSIENGKLSAMHGIDSPANLQCPYAIIAGRNSLKTASWDGGRGSAAVLYGFFPDFTKFFSASPLSL
jgi:hypothetical protein